MFTAMEMALVGARAKVDGWFRRVFKEQAGGAEVIATLIIVGIVLALALAFRSKLSELVADLWNGVVASKDLNSDPVIETWG